MRALSPSEALEQFVASNDGYLDVITCARRRRLVDARRVAGRPCADPSARPARVVGLLGARA
jgi:hypothetical protein